MKLWSDSLNLRMINAQELGYLSGLQALLISFIAPPLIPLALSYLATPLSALFALLSRRFAGWVTVYALLFPVLVISFNVALEENLWSGRQPCRGAVYALIAAVLMRMAWMVLSKVDFKADADREKEPHR